MHSSRTVFVLGQEYPNELAERLFDLGYVPLVRTKMQQALEVIRHEQCSAVVVDGDSPQLDILEFILNVRDVDGSLPIIVVGQPTDEHENRAVHKQQNTFVLKRSGKC